MIDNNMRNNNYQEFLFNKRVNECITKYGKRTIAEIKKEGLSSSDLSDYQLIGLLKLKGAGSSEHMEKTMELSKLREVDYNGVVNSAVNEAKKVFSHLYQVGQCFQEQFKEKNIVEYKGSFFAKMRCFFSKFFKEGPRSACSATYLRVAEINIFSK